MEAQSYLVTPATYSRQHPVSSCSFYWTNIEQVYEPLPVLGYGGLVGLGLPCCHWWPSSLPVVLCSTAHCIWRGPKSLQPQTQEVATDFWPFHGPSTHGHLFQSHHWSQLQVSQWPEEKTKVDVVWSIYNKIGRLECIAFEQIENKRWWEFQCVWFVSAIV